MPRSRARCADRRRREDVARPRAGGWGGLLRFAVRRRSPRGRSASARVGAVPRTQRSTGISSACSGVAWTAPSASGRSSLLSSTGSAARSAPSVSITARTEPIGDLVADFAGKLDHLAGDRAFHLDRRLVGHHVGDLLVLADRVADLDVPGDDLGLGNAFADVGQLEFVASHQSAITFSSARFMRFGPGK